MKKLLVGCLLLASFTVAAQDPGAKAQMEAERAEFEKSLQEKYAKKPQSPESYFEANPHVLILSLYTSPSTGQTNVIGPAYAYTFNKYFELGGEFPFAWLVDEERGGAHRTFVRSSAGALGIIPRVFVPVGEKVSLMFSVEPSLLFVQNPDNITTTDIRVGFGMEMRLLGAVIRFDRLEIASGIDYSLGWVHGQALYSLESFSGNIDFRLRF